MVTDKCVLLHIDFGYVLGAEPLIAQGLQSAAVAPHSATQAVATDWKA